MFIAPLPPKPESVHPLHPPRISDALKRYSNVTTSEDARALGYVRITNQYWMPHDEQMFHNAMWQLMKDGVDCCMVYSTDRLVVIGRKISMEAMGQGDDGWDPILPSPHRTRPGYENFDE